MLNLQPRQLAAIEDSQLRGFVERAQAFIRDHFPEVAQAYGNAALERSARLAIGRAGLYGMPGERDTTQLLVLMLLLGPDFDTDLPESPRIQQLLADRSREPGLRLADTFALVAPYWGHPAA